MRVLSAAASALRAKGELALVLTGDRAIRALNARYRHKDKPTDVLSFPGDGGELGLGDVVISVETAERNARSFGRSLAQELRESYPRWAFHDVDGVGHLLPWEAPETYIELVHAWMADSS